ncbi:glycosyltransferase family 2 protein [Capnocytophaga cynodegmi]|uniref:Putative Beta-(1,4)-galactosyltransferase, Family GT2 n=1 Tax=Capnocytophaga cynodegmi TaxID=28189 RepID=A0A0B7HE88_9FLAO|nr:glycosyltransferase [Capnocytophaga cynodegmi]CEN35893.1 putative Beta-(1,4)-galactosyltransferase, Family GT2 [Capnocytophaga cynodegmi]CEN36600.1 putative Beta-(1,4)-galactosyltransferase, Family GT2 [Capnocytophaga cynodegmi]
MKLSIIIPIYNSERYLGGCIQSLFDQKIPQDDFEIILINDGSSDQSLSVCHKLSKKYGNIKIISQINKGQSAARNVGFRKAKGKYIFFMDSDDHLKSGYLNHFLKVIEAKKLDFLGFGNYKTSKMYRFSDDFRNLEITIEGDGHNIIANYQYYNGSSWYLFERELAEEIQFEEGRTCEDVIFTTLLLLKVKNGCIYSNKIYGYYANSESTLKSKKQEQLCKVTNDMFYVALRFSEIIEQTDFKENMKVFNRLKSRQESYTYFAIVRFLRSKRKYSELEKFLSDLKECRYQAYPITNFKGYNRRDKLLIKCFNNKFFLQTFIKFNRLLNIFK